MFNKKDMKNVLNIRTVKLLHLTAVAMPPPCGHTAASQEEKSDEERRKSEHFMRDFERVLTKDEI